MKNKLKFGMMAIAGAILTATGSQAQDWKPEQPVRMIVAFAPGGPVDLVGREIAQRLGEYLDQTVIVENMGGAGGIIGAQHVAQADPDGQTIFFAAAGNVVIRPLVDNNTDIAKQLRSVGLVSKSPHAMVVRDGLDVQTVEELIAYAKAHPGELNFGSAGTGAAAHLGFEMFKQATGVEIEHIPYKGSAPAIVDLAAGAVDMSLSSIPSLTAMLEAGKIRMIALTDEAPTDMGVPKVSDTVEGYAYSTWYGVMAPAETAGNIVETLNKGLAFAVSDKALAERLAKMGAKLGHSTPEEMEAFFEQEVTRWDAVIEASGIRN
ncbi:Bug family tripartite tricarboxylate transporter substrate binding protein [Poseidonocella sedimentorum]|uniref:Tripartite-type tricarboxylate transporter, receptor component TctC n=1 Tax=Poseidonocella sedimentorum TaxID=871652 RepID=A0A1I6D7H4_9RHOB|nr:tripartite tricarboxylate transporter substrate-binding protein [Poseidonocella sedimentorum]SFR01420.1 Tripartite-type tricarboxylate transporter, receptor component TctC [Poseidonocella sedimentorum]